MTSRLQLILWLAGFLGNSLLFLVLAYKKQWRQFPVFTLLAGYESVRAIGLFILSRKGGHSVYQFAYWASQFVSIGLQVGLLRELGRTLVRSRSATDHSHRERLLPTHWSVLALVTACLCAMALPIAGSKPTILDMRASLFTSLLTCQLYLMILTRLNRLGLERNRQAMAIGNGIAIWSVCVVISDLIHQLRGWENRAVRFDEFRFFIVITMLVYWIIYFARSSAHLIEMKRSTKGLNLEVPVYAGRIAP